MSSNRRRSKNKSVATKATEEVVVNDIADDQEQNDLIGEQHEDEDIVIGDLESGDDAIVSDIVEEEPDVMEEEEEPDVMEEEEEEPVETASVESILDIDGIVKLLGDPDVILSEKLVIISKRGTQVFASLASKLLGYEESMGSGIVDSKLGASKQFDLYSTLKSVINEKDSNVYKVKFDIVNIAYIVFKDSAFKDVKLFRFADMWTWGDVQLEEYRNLNTVITQLADISKRSVNINKIDLKAALESVGVNFTPTAISNIKKYYTV